MGNREKLEIPTIEFTTVTLLNSNGNSCTCVRRPDCPDVWTDAAVNPDCGNDCSAFGEN